MPTSAQGESREVFMAELPRIRRASFSDGRRPPSSPYWDKDSGTDADYYPPLPSCRQPSPPIGSCISAVDSTYEENFRKAASLLLSRFESLVSSSVCEGCSSSLRSRLSSIASGDDFSPFQPENDQCRGVAHEVSPRQQFSSLSICDDVKEVVDYPATPSPQQQINRVRPSRKLHGAHNGRTDLIFRNAVNSMTIAAPHHKPQRNDKKRDIVENYDVTNRELHDNEDAQMQRVIRKKDYCLMEVISGKRINILQGLELHRNILNEAEQKELVKLIYHYRELGRNQKLRRRTFSEPRKWMRGKGRVTIQFGCCYNYAMDKDGNPPGIIRDEEVDEIPEQFRMIIMRLVRWNVLPSSCIPDSCIVNIYDVGDCIPPHIDHHDFLRPFCTLSLLSECNIIFGNNLKIIGPGDFEGSISIPLPTGSVFILNGNGADIAKHAVPAVPTKRISITFRKMDPTKVPYGFKPDLELLSTKPVMNGSSHSGMQNASHVANAGKSVQSSKGGSLLLDSDFPALGNTTHSDNFCNSWVR